MCNKGPNTFCCKVAATLIPIRTSQSRFRLRIHPPTSPKVIPCSLCFSPNTTFKSPIYWAAIVPLESVNLFLHVFLCLKVILTMELYIKLLTIFIWKFAIFWSWQLAPWNLGQFAPASFFTCNRLTCTMFEIFMMLTSPRIR